MSVDVTMAHWVTADQGMTLGCINLQLLLSLGLSKKLKLEDMPIFHTGRVEVTIRISRTTSKVFPRLWAVWRRAIRAISETETCMQIDCV